MNLNVIGAAGARQHRPAVGAGRGNWLRDMGTLIALGVVFTLLTWLQMRRLGPRRRKG